MLKRPSSAPPQYKKKFAKIQKISDSTFFEESGNSKGEKAVGSQEGQFAPLAKYELMDEVDISASSTVSKFISKQSRDSQSNNQHKRSVRQLFEDWRNPCVFSAESQPKRLFSNTSKMEKSESNNNHLDLSNDLFHLGFVQNKIKINKEDLIGITVINQVDNKFILTKMTRGQLVIFDQHAVDERIQLEELENHIFMKIVDGRGFAFPNIEAQQLEKPIECSITLNEMLQLQKYQTILESFKWRFTFSSQSTAAPKNSAQSIESNHLLLQITQIPLVLGVPIDNKHDLFDFLSELGEITNPHLVTPKCIQYILHSKACRGAIMFGQSLSKQECYKLIGKLCLTRFPFQCAHGRPSIFPLLQF